ncbi:MAG TPA: DUF4062 domain-containing protein [Thermoanaerobaculia bacterium]|jgi:hypothetical protein|nr:DUF4062 domain-containing protein [Thermoanaerobaculia bacterium]
MDKRFQVFVSSTYEDLQAERQEVMQALLELDCIPAGMELFPAANESQWTFIKRIIGDCDYYIVIVAGRYGSLNPQGIGYTEMEYRYATEIGKPTIAFLHRDPEQLPLKRTERTPEGQKLLRDFRAHVEGKLCKQWSSPAELGSVVSRSLVQLMKANPGIGWVRGTDAGDPAETARLRARIEELEAELAALASTGPSGTEALAQGPDRFGVDFSYSVYVADTYKTIGPGKGTRTLVLTWDEIMSIGLPPLLVEGSEEQVERRLEDYFRKREGARLLAPEGGPARGMNVDLSRLSLQQIIIQFRALGLIAPSIRQRSLRDTSTYWKLSPYGATVMTRLCAIRRDEPM